MSEARLRTRIVKALTAYSGYWFITHQTGTQEKGLPDVMGVYSGMFYALEIKLPGKEYTLTQRQSWVLKKIRLAGGKAAVITSVDDAMNFVFGSAP
jgi:hypothetical protein